MVSFLFIRGVKVFLQNSRNNLYIKFEVIKSAGCHKPPRGVQYSYNAPGPLFLGIIGDETLRLQTLCYMSGYYVGVYRVVHQTVTQLEKDTCDIQRSSRLQRWQINESQMIRITRKGKVHFKVSESIHLHGNTIIVRGTITRTLTFEPRSL